MGGVDEFVDAILADGSQVMTDAAIFRERLKELLKLGKLTSNEIYFILNLMQEKYGFGYSDAVEGEIRVGALQAKLSVLLELALKEGR